MIDVGQDEIFRKSGKVQDQYRTQLHFPRGIAFDVTDHADDPAVTPPMDRTGRPSVKTKMKRFLSVVTISDRSEQPEVEQ